MNNPWLIISIVIALIIMMVFAWQYIKRRRRRNRVRMAERPERDLYTDQYFDEPSLDDKPDNLLEEPPLVEDVIETPLTETEKVSEVSEVSESPHAKAFPQNELIIILYVVAKHEVGFSGDDIFTVLEDLGLRYGEMHIFHHYGVGELKVKKPVFSLANMIEPGIFEPQQKSQFTSPGLVLFMRLPGPFGGRVAFELMLNSAKKIAEILEGILQDETHTTLEPNKISSLREKIAHFEQRSTHLAMPKRFN